jgi:hypothetical protein
MTRTSIFVVRSACTTINDPTPVFYKKNLFLEPYFCITMPPKKAPLYCLVHGDPEDSMFGIRYDKNTTVDEIRKAIWLDEVEVPGHVKAKDLRLYQVNINLTTQNPQRTALGNPDADIVTALGGQLLKPADNVEEKFPAPDNKNIHIIVNVPTVALPVAGK